MSLSKFLTTLGLITGLVSANIIEIPSIKVTNNATAITIPNFSPSANFRNGTLTVEIPAANTVSSRPQNSSINLVLDANNGTGNLYLYPKLDPANNNHLWTITPLSDGYFMITSKRNGYALDANGGTGNLYLHPNPDTRNPNHYWRLTQVGGFYMITSRVNGYALDANGGTGNLYLHPNPDRGNSNHLWKIVNVGNYKAIGSALRN